MRRRTIRRALLVVLLCCVVWCSTSLTMGSYLKDNGQVDSVVETAAFVVPGVVGMSCAALFAVLRMLAPRRRRFSSRRRRA